MTDKNRYPAICTRCGASRGLKRKNRMFSLCRPCSFLQSSETKLIKSDFKFKEQGLDIKRTVEPDGRVIVKFKVNCPSCGKDKDYVRKASIGSDCFQCSANKSGLKNKGSIPPNRGIPSTKEAKIKISCTKQGIDIKDFTGFITQKDQVLRTQPIVISLRKAAFKRDGFTCQCCLKKGVKLNAHHLNSWKHYPNDRYNIDNLITLCEACHIQYHALYGRGTSKNKPANTKEQFVTFKENYGKKEN